MSLRVTVHCDDCGDERMSWSGELRKGTPAGWTTRRGGSRGRRLREDFCKRCSRQRAKARARLHRGES